MRELETEFGRVEMDEVGIDISESGNVSIFRFGARRLEALEGVVAFLRNNGFKLVEFQEPPAERESGEPVRQLPPRVVYLSSPSPRAEIFTHRN